MSISGPFALFILAHTAGGGIGAAERAAVEAVLTDESLASAVLYRPVEDAPDHPFAADGLGPALALELRYATRAAAEAALTPGRLGRLRLPEARISHQLFAARDFAVEDAAFRTPEPCTFLVQYDGHAPDPEAWLDHYDRHHPPIMTRFPGIRRVAAYRPVAWASELDWARDDVLQRNRVAFDSPAALAAALASPVMTEMRADRAAFPAFEGQAAHHPMWTRVLR